MVLLSKQAFTPKPTRAATPDLRPLIQSRQGKPLRTRKALRRQARQNDAADDAQIQCLPALRCHSAQNEQGAGSAANTGLPLQHQMSQALGELLGAARGLFAAAAAAAVLNLTAICPPASAQDIARFPASHDPQIFAVQRTMVEAWSIVDEAFFDSSYGGRDWEQELGSALTHAHANTEAGGAYKEISTMLQKLGDPFTRIVPPSEYQDFRVSSDGELQGVGLLIASDPSNGHLVVLASISGGPADRAGVQAGDEVASLSQMVFWGSKLLSIDGRSTDGWDGDHAAKYLRGRSGSSVMVRFGRRTDQLPGVAGRPEATPRTEYRQMMLQRERLDLSPVFSTSMQHEGHRLGYIRLASFSQKAANDMRRAIDRLEDDGAEAFILDLRNNPGGLVRAGLDIARLWLRGPSEVFTIQGRTDPSQELTQMQHVVLDDGVPETSRPLTVLVNGGSASASEILAGALHDSGRATLVGDKTFGKGKIQSVFELSDGSALFVTVARYRTPLDKEIDLVGIQPDRACSLMPNDLQASPFLAGVPLGPGAFQAVASQLQTDSCVVTAEKVLGPQLRAQAEPRLSTPAQINARM